MLADVERQAAGEHQQHSNQCHGGDGQHGGADAACHLFPRLLDGLLHIFQIDTGTEHPIPAVEHHDVGQLIGDLPGGRFLPVVALEAIAGCGAFQQSLDHRQTVWIGHAP
ncbi:hypothetical protein D9M68_894300 [compost metagenome]